MKKKLFVFFVAVVCSFSFAVNLAACDIPDSDTGHAHNYIWINSGSFHQQNCPVPGCDEPMINIGNHSYNDGECICGAKDVGHQHNYIWVNNFDGTHCQRCRVYGCVEPTINSGKHVYNDGEMDLSNRPLVCETEVKDYEDYLVDWEDL